MGQNPYLDRRTRRVHGQKAERKTAKRLQGRGVPASGALDGAKGDIQKAQFLMECKATINKSLSLQLVWLKKITKEAVAVNRDPALTIQFVGGNGESTPDGAWVMIPERVFRELVE